jgi:hypothetical protein
VLCARREADLAWRALFDLDSFDPQPAPLLIYVPAPRGNADDEEARRADPFEPFALCGAAFGNTEAERLPSIARQVLVGREGDVDRLFAEGEPSLSQLDALAAGTRYPLIDQVLGTETPGRIAATLLCRPGEMAEHLKSAPGLEADLRRLLRDAYGFDPAQSPPLDGLASAFAQWILFSELAFERPDVVPAPLVQVPRASRRFRRAIVDLGLDLRLSTEHRGAYCDIATGVEQRLGLSSLEAAQVDPGERDGFPFEDRAALRHVQQQALAGKTTAARTVAIARKSSVWRTLPERDQLWRLAERCLDLLDAGAAWEARQVGGSRPVADHVRAYCSEQDGMWRLDQAQRLVEQAAALLVDRESLAPLSEHVRREYRRWLDATQDAFVSSVVRAGWPPEGLTRQSQAWSRHAAGPVADGRRTAWFLVDALRFEMGRELADRLRTAGVASVEPACGVVPAATPFGMAALLPGADSALTYGESEGSLVPLLAGRPVVTADDRRKVLRTELGDRFQSVRLGELLTAGAAQLRQRVGSANVLAVFSTEIDDLGEHNDPLVARRYISEVVADLLAAANRLVELGFERLVFAADHGFIQLPEVLPGDQCPEPAGEWLLTKRRALLGALGGRGDDLVTLAAVDLGIQGPVKNVCIPRGVKVFRAGSPYFHEGLSLQECVIPIVVLDAKRRQPMSDAAPHIGIYYRSDRFTTRIFSVQISYASLLDPELAVRVQAFAPGAAEVVGEAADCEARDPHTGLITLSATQRTHVPIALEPDFDGDAVDIRVTDANAPGRAYASLTLRNASLD